MAAFRVTQMKVGTMDNFVYLLVDERSREGLAVDSGWETSPIVKQAEAEGAQVKFVVATHGHFDHTSTLQELATRLGARVVAHERSPTPHDVSVKDGDVLNLGTEKVRVVYTPGHTEDSICLYDGAHVFTGDTLFIGNCGRVDLEGGSPEKMFRSLHDVLLRLPEETVIYPGHDYGEVPYRTLREEKAANPFLAAEDLNAFLSTPD
jgi:hydroxyacylglutathione hydrolase